MPPNNQSNPYVLPPKPERPRHEDAEQVVVVQPEQPAGNASAPTGPGGPDYGFIMEPPKPPRQSLKLPGLGGSSSMPVRIGMVLGGLLVLIIIFAVAKSLFSGGGNTQALTAVAQQQQSMIHIVTNGAGSDSQQAALSNANQNFAATAKVSLTSTQQQLLQYMANNHKKVSTKTLALKISPTIDQQLSESASNSTYDATFKQVMQDQLGSYEKALQAAYQQTTGPRGRALLKDEFQGAQLLLTQLNSPAS